MRSFLKSCAISIGVLLFVPAAYAKDGCADYQKVLATASDGFASLRGETQPTFFGAKLPGASVHKAKSTLGGFTDCSILSWPGGDTTFACMVQFKDERSGRAAYANGTKLARTCLKDWKAVDAAPPPDNPRRKTLASVHLRRAGLGFLASLGALGLPDPTWTTFVSISAKD